MKRSRPSMDKILEAQIQLLTTTRRPKTVRCYRYCAHNFLAYLHTTFPRLHKLSQLRRDPYLLAWFRFLCQQYPSPGNRTRHLHLLTVRRLLRDLANQGHPVTPDLVGREDFPPPDHYLPQPLSLGEDQQMQQQLKRRSALWRAWWSWAPSRELGGGGEPPLLCRGPKLSYCLATGNLRLGTGCCTTP
jgi:hypothetical protein